jgi:hypothetical protein
VDSAPMRAVLGIDAAWTLSQPSGVAVMNETSTGWRLVAAEASYQRFDARANGLRSHSVGATPTLARGLDWSLIDTCDNEQSKTQRRS